MTQPRNTIITLDMSHLWQTPPGKRHGDGAATAATIARAREALHESGPPTQAMRLSDLLEPEPQMTLEELAKIVESDFQDAVADMDRTFGSLSTPPDFSREAEDDLAVRNELSSNLGTTFGARYTNGIYASVALDIYSFFQSKYALLPKTVFDGVRFDAANESAGENE